MSSSLPSSLSRVPRSRFFEWWAKSVLFVRWPVLVSCALFSYWMASQAADGLRLDSRLEAFLPRSSEAAQALEALREDFGEGAGFQVVVEGDVFSRDFLERLADLQADLAQLQLTDEAPSGLQWSPLGAEVADESTWGSSRLPFARVDSALDAGRLVQRNGEVAYTPWLDPLPKPEPLRALGRQMLQDPALVGHLVGREGRHAVIELRPVELSETALLELHGLVEDVAGLYDAPGFRTALGGSLAIDAAVTEGMLADQSFLLGAEAVAMLLVMWIVFRHVVGVLGPLLVVAQAAVVMFGWMALVNIPLTWISAVLGALVLCVGTAFALSVQTAYREARLGGFDIERSVVHAVAATGVPVLFTTLITCVALLSFFFARMQPVRDLGLAGATGVFFAGVFALVFLPAWLALGRRGGQGPASRPASEQRPKAMAERLLEACDRLTRRSPRRRQWVLGFSLLAALLACIGALRLRPHHDPLDWLPADVPAAAATRALDRYTGGSSDLALIVTPKGDRDLRDPEVLQALRAVAEGIQSRHTGAETVAPRSVLGRVAEARRVLQLEPVDGLPATRAEANDLFTLWQLLSPDRLGEHATLDLSRGLLELRVPWRDAAEYEALTAHVEQLSATHLQPVADVQLAGAAYGMFTVVQSLMRDLFWSFLAAVLVITLMVVLLSRDLRMALVAMLPNLWPVLGVLGFMGFSGCSVDVQNVALASIAIGLSVDNTIQFLHQFRVHFAGYGDVDAAVAYAFHRSGRAMLGTSLVLLVGFGVLGLGYMSSTRTFGLLCALAVLLGLIGDLVMLPALLRTLYKSRPRVYDPEVASSYDLTLSEFS